MNFFMEKFFSAAKLKELAQKNCCQSFSAAKLKELAQKNSCHVL